METPGTGAATDPSRGSPTFRPASVDPDLEDENDPTSRLDHLDEAAPGDPQTISGMGLKATMVPLGRTPWERSRRTLHPEERRYVKRLDGVHCFVSVIPAGEHAGHTGRGRREQEGWMLDCEVRLPGSDRDGRDDRWIFHTERRYPDPASAEAAQEDVMEFLDGHTLRSLLDVPRSGPLSMSAWRD